MFQNNNHLVIKRKIKKIVAEFGNHKSDCGSMHVQVMCINERIRNLKRHIEDKNKNDIHNRRRLVTAFQRRARMIKYLQTHKSDIYAKYLDKLKF